MAHIPLWLIKDMCWLFTWKTAGLIIAIPTVLVALIIVWVTRKDINKLMPNISIAFWIIANANWMVAEFYDLDTRFYSVYPFSAGVLVFLLFFIRYLRKPQHQSSFSRK